MNTSHIITLTTMLHTIGNYNNNDNNDNNDNSVNTQNNKCIDIIHRDYSKANLLLMVTYVIMNYCYSYLS